MKRLLACLLILVFAAACTAPSSKDEVTFTSPNKTTPPSPTPVLIEPTETSNVTDPSLSPSSKPFPSISPPPLVAVSTDPPQISQPSSTPAVSSPSPAPTDVIPESSPQPTIEFTTSPPVIPLSQLTSISLDPPFTNDNGAITPQLIQAAFDKVHRSVFVDILNSTNPFYLILVDASLYDGTYFFGSLNIQTGLYENLTPNGTFISGGYPLYQDYVYVMLAPLNTDPHVSEEFGRFSMVTGNYSQILSANKMKHLKDIFNASEPGITINEVTDEIYLSWTESAGKGKGSSNIFSVAVSPDSGIVSFSSAIFWDVADEATNAARIDEIKTQLELLI